MIAREGKHSRGGRVHALQADWASGQLNEAKINRVGFDLLPGLELDILHKEHIANIGLEPKQGRSERANPKLKNKRSQKPPSS